MINVRYKSSFDVDKLSKAVQKVITDIKDQTIRTAKSHTPVRSGFAKSQWKKKSTSTGFSVSNSVDYIQFLDKGSSRQAPQGITKPTVRKMTGYIKSRRLKR